MIIGQPGSGKSTLAQKIGNLTGLPVVHIDRIHWMSGWRERSPELKNQMCAEVHARDRWIFEGGRSATWGERLDRADILIWLDIPLWLRSYRVVRRTIQYYGHSRPDLPEGCPEQFNWEFTSWIWRTRKTGRKKMRSFYFNAPLNKRKYHIQSKRQLNQLMRELTH